MKYQAESVGAHQVEPWADKLWRDVDKGMAAPEKFGGAVDSEEQARGFLVTELGGWAEYYKGKPGEHYRAEAELYHAAAMVISAGSTAVKVHGRYYRVREVG